MLAIKDRVDENSSQSTSQSTTVSNTTQSRHPISSEEQTIENESLVSSSSVPASHSTPSTSAGVDASSVVYPAPTTDKNSEEHTNSDSQTTSATNSIDIGAKSKVMPSDKTDKPPRREELKDSSQTSSEEEGVMNDSPSSTVDHAETNGEHLQEQCDISCNTNEEKSTDEHRVSETLTVHGASCDQSDENGACNTSCEFDVVEGPLQIARHPVETIPGSMTDELSHSDLMTAHSIPTHVKVSVAILTATVHFRFDESLQKQIKGFIVEVTSAILSNHSLNIDASDREAEISFLVPDTLYNAKVIAMYVDGFQAISETVSFTTGRIQPSDMNIAVYHGPPSKTTAKQTESYVHPVYNSIPSETAGKQFEQNSFLVQPSDGYAVYQDPPSETTETAYEQMCYASNSFESKADDGTSNFTQDLQRRVDDNPHKHGIAILCVNNGSPDSHDYIENSTAMDRMRECFETKLGYLTIRGSNVTTSQLDELLKQIVTLNLPESISRVVFYFFGHGNADSVRLDEYVERSYIISKLQFISPAECSKIIIFECCRVSDYVTCEAVQESQDDKSPPQFSIADFKEDSIPVAVEHPRRPFSNLHVVNTTHYPTTANTLVINATEMNGKAYYRVTNGCGLLTQCFTEMATTRNESLQELLVSVRRKIAKEHSCTQIVTYEDKLMGKCNLLAESQGTARVVPNELSINVGILATTVRFRFDENVEKRIAQFFAEIYSDAEHISVCICASDHIAVLCNLVPDTVYTVRVVAEYEDRFRVESETVSFTTPERDTPSDIKVMLPYPGSSSARVEWSFSGETANLSYFRITTQVDGKQPMIQDVPSNILFTDVKGLLPEKEHQITVSAVYQDKVEKKCSLMFYNSDLVVASIKSVCMTHISASDLCYRVEFSYDHDQLEADHFRVIATPTSAEPEGILAVQIDNPYCRQAELRLIPGTKYSLAVMTYYTNSIIQPQKSKEDILVPVPMLQEVTPTLKIETVRQSSAIVTISHPPILQSDTIELTRVKYSIKEYDEWSTDITPQCTFNDFNPPCFPRRHSASSNVSQRKVNRLKSGRKYTMKLSAEYSSGDHVETEEVQFQTPQYTVRQKICYNCGCLALFGFLMFLMLSSFFLIASYGVYDMTLATNTECTTSYLVTGGTIACGQVNSLQYGRIKLSGERQSDDSLLTSIKAWNVRQNELDLYSSPHPPIFDRGHTISHTRHLLNGWNIYLWEGSVISGSCCISNNGSTEQIASMKIFISDVDAITFMDGGEASNTVLSDVIRIPPGLPQYFDKWGSDSPFNVTHNSYHFIVIDLPENLSFVSNVTVLQQTVNTTDYATPHYFQYSNSTDFALSEKPFSDVEYVAICEIDTTAQVGDAIHVKACSEPYVWMKLVFISSLVLGLLIFVVSILHFVCMCVYVCKLHRDKLFFPCKYYRHRHCYSRLHELAV